MSIVRSVVENTEIIIEKEAKLLQTDQFIYLSRYGFK